MFYATFKFKIGQTRKLVPLDYKFTLYDYFWKFVESYGEAALHVYDAIFRGSSMLLFMALSYVRKTKPEKIDMG